MLGCCRQSQAEAISNSRNKIHQTWAPPFSRALYLPQREGNVGFRHREIPRASLPGDQISVILPIARVSEAREPFGTMYFRQAVYEVLCANDVCTEVV